MRAWVAVLFILFSYHTCVFAQKAYKNKEYLNLLSARARALKNLRRYKDAQQVYEKIFKLGNVPLEICLDYLDIVPKKNLPRYFLLLEDQIKQSNNQSLKIRFAFKKAEFLAFQGKYKQAVKLIAPYKEIPDNRLYSAYFYNLAGKWSEAERLVKTIITDSYYTPYEKRKANYFFMDIARLWHRRFSFDFRYIHNSFYGHIKQLWSRLKYPLDEWGLLELNGYTLYSKGKIGFKHGNEYYDYSVRGKQQFGFLSFKKIQGANTHWLLEGLYTDNRLGFKVGYFLHRDHYHFGLSGWYQDVEKEITSLSTIFALKKGIEIEGSYKPNEKFILGLKETYNRYYFPSTAHLNATFDYDNRYLGWMISSEPYIIYIQRDKSPTLRHGFGWLYINGHQDDTLPYIIPNRLNMPYYSLSGLYYFGKRKNVLSWRIPVGYVWGDNFSGLAVSPYVSLWYSLTKNIDFLTSFAYCLDITSGTTEIRARAGVVWRF